MTLRWEGERVTKRLRTAMVAGVNETMSAAAIHAKRNHEWANQTGTLEGSIGIAEFAAATPKGVRGLWGSQDVVYARIRELGGTIRPVKAKALVFEIGGETVVVQKVVVKAQPYLRPAADAEYPGLAGRIRRHLG